MAGKAEILFIDGDHSFEGVRADFERFHELVADGGVIVFHDVGLFPSGDTALLAQIRHKEPDDGQLPNADGTGVYHRPGTARAMDWIVANHPEYSLVLLTTLAEPCCGMAVLQKTVKVFKPSPVDTHLATVPAS